MVFFQTHWKKPLSKPTEKTLCSMTFTTLYSLKKYFWMGCARVSLCSIERRKRETHSRNVLRMRELFPFCPYPRLQMTLWWLCTNFCNIRHSWSVTANSALIQYQQCTMNPKTCLFFIPIINCALSRHAEQCTSGTQEADAITSEQEGTQASHKYRQPTQQGLPPSNKLSISTCEKDSPCRHQIVLELFSYINSKRRGLL